MDAPVWIALFSTAASGRASLALVTGGALSGIGVAYRILVENDPVGMETFSTAALLLTLALLGDSVHRRRVTEKEPSVAIRNDRRLSGRYGPPQRKALNDLSRRLRISSSRTVAHRVLCRGVGNYGQ